MADIAPIAGVLVGFQRRPYAPFTDRETGQQVAGGETFWVYVAPEGGAGAPASVKVGQAEFDTLQGAGFGAWFEGQVELRARRNQVVRSLAGISRLAGDGEPERGLSAV